MKKVEIELPPTYTLGGRNYSKRSEIEHTKNCLIARATGREDPQYIAPDIEQFVPATQVAKEFGISKRTHARRMAEREKSHAA